MLNNITLQGRLTSDIELKQTPSGKSVISFSIACERNSKGADGNKATDFIRCVAWNKTAEFIKQYFHKGNMILLNGELQSRDWTDNEGKKRTEFEVNVLNTYFCSNKKDGQEEAKQDSENEVQKSEESVNPNFEQLDQDGDLPF